MESFYRHNAQRFHRHVKAWGSALLLFFSATVMYAQTITVTGQVQDETGLGMPGVNILVKETGQGTVTDQDGNYRLQVATGNTMVFSFTGYVKREVTVGSQTTINLQLEIDPALLGDVVVIGYGEQSTKEVTTAIVKVGSEQIEALPVYRPEQALQGTAPGIIVLQESGSPGAPLTIRIRGIASAQNSSPLYLIDGVQVPNLDHLNSADIDNISVLKDAASAAIYGARGGNGVVLVTTKKGRRDFVNPQITFSGYVGSQNLANKPDLMNRDEFIDFFNNSVDWYTQFTDGSTIPRGKFTTAEAAQLPDTDWYDEVFKPATMQNYHASLQDGGSDYSYAIGAGWFSQDGMVGGDRDKSNFERTSFNLNYEKDLFPGFNLDVRGTYTQTDRNSLNENSAGTGSATMNYINSIPAIYPIHAANGEIFNPGRQVPPPNFNGVDLPIVGAVTNPFLALELNNTNTVTDYITAGVGASYEFGQFKVNSRFSYYGFDQLTRSFVPTFNYPEQTFANARASLTETTSDFSRTQWENTITYTMPDNGDHSLDALAGMSIIEDEFNIHSQSGIGFLANDLNSVNFSLMEDISTLVTNPVSTIENGWLSFFGRVNYSFKEKILVSATLRADASSKFGADNRWGYFPSVSAGWNVSEESFLKDNPVINLLKVRASWGKNGNDQIGSYQYLTTLTTNAGYVIGGNQTLGIAPTILANPDIKWEEVDQTNFGIDANLFNNMLGVSLDYYIKKTSDMLAPVGTPLLVGQAAPFKNVADVENKGIELLLSHKRIVGDFSYNIGFNIARNTNSVTSLGEGLAINSANIQPSWPGPIARTDVGRPIASFYGYKVAGLDEQGDLIFEDLDGVPGITADDQTFIGNPYPDFTYGITLGFDYKGFDFSTFLFGSSGNDIYKAYLRPDAANTNRPSGFSDSWTVNNRDTNVARSTLFGLNGNLGQVSDYYIEDGSFAKLKTLTIGYTFNEEISRKVGASRIRIYFTANNLFTITDYTGADPEIGQSSSAAFLDVGIDRGFYPQPRTFIGGFQINLF